MKKERRKPKFAILSIALILTVAIAAFLLINEFRQEPTPAADVLIKHEKVVYGISPYQDTILPRVSEKLEWDTEEKLDIDTRMLAWDDVMPAVANGTVDVAIQNFNSFQATYENINKTGGDVIFYYPLFIFKGAAIMVRSDSDLKSLAEMQEIYEDREQAITETVKQLKGKTVFTTKATETEQLVLLALENAGMKPEEVNIVDAPPDECLSAFLRGDAQAFTGGVTDQLKVQKEGHKQLISAADLGLVVVDGLVTTEHYAKEHPEVLEKLIKLWFRTIRYLDEDLNERTKIVIEDLNREGSYTFSVDDYIYSWEYTDIYPNSPQEIGDLLLSPDSPYYWQNSWDKNNQFLIEENRIEQPVPYDAFWMKHVHPAIIKTDAEAVS